MSAEQTNAVTLFYCYAHEDESFRQELEEHLASFKRQGHLVSWSDREITPGTTWRQEIETHLTSAHLILLFISPSFLYSDACDAEMHQALALGKAGRAWIIPILVRPVIWQQTPLAGLQFLPVDGKPISRWEDRDDAWQQVALHIGRIVSERLGFPFIPPEALSAPTLKAQEPASLTPDLSFKPRNPYKGLRPFTEKDSGDFFGRERLIADLREQLRATLSLGAPDTAPHLLSVFGPSGSGKSSVVQAGLLPALRRGALPGSEHWTYLKPISPGVRPLEALARTFSYYLSALSLTSIEEDLKAPDARGLHKLADRLLQGEASMVVLYIDQFEELFTQTLEEAERVQFIDLLVTAVTEPHGPLLVFLSLRADFYDRPMRFPDLFRLIEATQAAVLPLASRNLRNIITKPAALPDVQLQFEDDLIGELLADMYGQSGALPLLQFALDRLFQKRQDRLLTVLAYEEMGRLQGALVQHAEATYALLPTEEYCVLTRLLFLRLVEPGAIGQDPIRRRMVLGEIAFTNPAREAILEKIIDIFTTARLLTTSDQQEGAVVEVSHEALIRGWPRLEDWLREAYEDLSLQRRVREDAASWIRLGRPARRLYYDDQLKEALGWKQRSLLSHEEEEFLVASVNEEEQQRKRELVQRRRYQRRAVLIGLVLTTLATAATSGGILLFRGNQPLRGKQLFPASTPAPRALPYSYHNHTDIVESVAWSPDGKRLASASDDRTVQVWDVSNGQTLLIYHGHLDVVKSVAWSPDGKRLASASNDQTVQIWDASSGRTLFTYDDRGGNVNSVAWSPDGKRLASANDDGTVQVWDTRGEILLSYNGHAHEVYSVAWSPDGKRLASANNGGTVQVWDASSGATLLTYRGHSNIVYSVAWSPDGKYLASASEDQTARIWDASSGATLLTYQGHTHAVNSVAWSPNGKLLASASFERGPNFGGSQDQTVQIWDASSGQTLFTYHGHLASVLKVAWSPDGKRLASASADTTVQVWKAGSGQTVLTHHSNAGFVYSVTWSPDGKRLACEAGLLFGMVQVLDARSGKTLVASDNYFGGPLTVFLFSFPDGKHLAWSPDGKYLASADNSTVAQVRDASSGETLAYYQNTASSIFSVAWSPDGRRLAFAGEDQTNQTVQVFDARGGQPLLTYHGHNDAVNSMAWSPDGKYLASGSADETAQVWDASSGQMLLTYHSHADAVSCVAWSPNGRYLASASNDATIKVWNASSGQTLQTYHGHADAVNSVVWSPDGKYLASASNDQTVQVWDASSVQTLLTYRGHADIVGSVAWSPSGEFLASGSKDATAQVWAWLEN